MVSKVEGIGIELKGKYVGIAYYMTNEEIEKEKQGDIAVIGSTTYVYKNGEEYREHNYDILNMDIVENIDIFYDTEDDYKMDQKFHLKDGSTLYSVSRNHKEVKLWEQKGIPITKSYGW